MDDYWELWTDPRFKPLWAEVQAMINANLPEIEFRVLSGGYDPFTRSGLPALPVALWCSGMPWGIAMRLKEHYGRRYFCVLGCRKDGYFVEGRLKDE